jgi:beta-galactoside alpha-2,3-sialyltransferase (sialyltransferase 4A)
MVKVVPCASLREALPGSAVLRGRALGIASVVIVLLVVPQRAAVQELNPPDPQIYRDLETSADGPLQRRLEAAYPDSFSPGVDFFWEPRDGWISPEVFDWWASRLSEGDREDLTPEAAQRMFARISRQSPVMSIKGGRQICAVVGASRNLFGSRYGRLIDAHDVVFRVNRAPTEFYETDVGDKTTYHVMWPRVFGEGQFNRRAILLMTPVAADTDDVFDRINILVEHELHWDPNRVRIIHPEFVKYLHENWTDGRKAYPSTGFIAMMIAVHVCEEVDLFGFGADANGRWDRYYEDYPEEVSSIHPVDFEVQLRREMEERGLLRVFRGVRDDP